MGKELLEIHKHYIKTDEFLKYCNIERDRLVVESRISEGIRSGRRKGLEDALRQFILARYHIDASSSINQCTSEQLERAFQIAGEQLSYEEFQLKLFEDVILQKE